MSSWMSLRSCSVHLSKQISPEWSKCRIGRLTYSSMKEVTNNPSNFESIIHHPLEIPEDVKLLKGIRCEPAARELYSRIKRTPVEQWGLAVSKKYPLLSGSVDGYVPELNRIIEIKCPETLYARLPKISRSHLEQMIWNMGIVGVSSCDYVVYESEEKYYIQTVYFSKNIWNNLLEQAMKIQIENKMSIENVIYMPTL